MSCYTAEQRREILARSRALLAKAAPADPDAGDNPVIFKVRDEALVIDAKPKPVRTDDRRRRRRQQDDSVTEIPSAGLPVEASSTLTTDDEPWWRWVEQHCDYRAEVTHAVVAQVVADVQADAREVRDRDAGIVERELQLMRRELDALHQQVALERGLRDLRTEVEAARAEIPKMPAIAKRLEAEQARLRSELADTRLKLRVHQSTTDYGISELRRQQAATKVAAKTAAAKAASVEMEFEARSSRFVMRDIDLAAAEALHEFASQAVSTWQERTSWIFNPAGTA